ncbi:MAG: heparan-alpha-glucosaminide N-acetyltransferase domain-containing protein [Actinomycetota bacterium]
MQGSTITAPTTTRPAPVTPEAGAARPQRLTGIDIARGVALIGMFTVHVTVGGDGATRLPGPIEWWLTAPSGRASVLFMLLAGVSLSVIRARNTASSTGAAIRRRGVALILLGLLLSATVWPASILEHYGVLFLLAPILLSMTTRRLAVITAMLAVIGPVVHLWTPVWSDAQPLDGPVIGWLYQTVVGLWFNGVYPLVVWLPIFALGLLIGRLDLTDRRIAGALAGAGVAVVVVVQLTSTAFAAVGVEPAGFEDFGELDGTTVTDDGAEVDAFASADAAGGPDDEAAFDECLAEFDEGVVSEDCEAWFFADESGGEFAGAIEGGERTPLPELLSTGEHSGRTAWMLESAAIAAAILGVALALPHLGRRLLAPLAALGSMSLTAYLLHIVLVRDVYDQYVDGAWTLWAQFGTLVALQALLVAVAVVIRRRFRRGPAEWALKMVTGAT